MSLVYETKNLKMACHFYMAEEWKNCKQNHRDLYGEEPYAAQ
jgi:hypothetical protein